jgi:hypothetical protein
LQYPAVSSGRTYLVGAALLLGFAAGPMEECTADTEAPTAPVIGPRLTNSDYAGFRWTSSSDNVGVTGYRVTVDGVLDAVLPADTIDHVVEVAPSAPHTVSLTAFDAAGNESAPSSFSFTSGPRPTAGNEAVNLYWDEGGYRASTFEVPFAVQAVGPTSNLFFSQVVDFGGPASGYVGFQQKNGDRIAWVSFWSTINGSLVGKVIDYEGDYAANCSRRPDEPGIFQPWACEIDFDWQVGDWYLFRLERLGPSPTDHLGSRWEVSISGIAVGGDPIPTTILGRFVLAAPNGETSEIVDTVTFLEEFTVDPFCRTPPETVLEVGAPTFDFGSARAQHDVTIPGPCSAGNSEPSAFFGPESRRLSMGR